MTKLAFECSESWDAMTPVQGGRHCDTCNKTVVDVRGKTRAQFNAICASAGAGLCVRANANKQGELVFARKRRLPLVAQAAFAVALAACSSNGTRENVVEGELALDDENVIAVAGGISPPEPLPTPAPPDAGVDASFVTSTIQPRPRQQEERHAIGTLPVPPRQGKAR